MPHLHHYALIPYLPGQTLRNLHRDICQLRGARYGTPNPQSPYVLFSPWSTLLGYHAQVLQEFKARGYRFAPNWTNPNYRGKRLPPWEAQEATILVRPYPEHTPDHYTRSLALLEAKSHKYTPEDLYRLKTAPRAIP